MISLPFAEQKQRWNIFAMFPSPVIIYQHFKPRLHACYRTGLRSNIWLRLGNFHALALKFSSSDTNRSLFLIEAVWHHAGIWLVQFRHVTGTYLCQTKNQSFVRKSVISLLYSWNRKHLYDFIRIPCLMKKTWSRPFCKAMWFLY